MRFHFIARRKTKEERYLKNGQIWQKVGLCPVTLIVYGIDCTVLEWVAVILVTVNVILFESIANILVGGYLRYLNV